MTSKHVDIHVSMQQLSLFFTTVNSPSSESLLEARRRRMFPFPCDMNSLEKIDFQDKFLSYEDAAMHSKELVYVDLCCVKHIVFPMGFQ